MSDDDDDEEEEEEASIQADHIKKDFPPPFPSQAIFVLPLSFAYTKCLAVPPLPVWPCLGESVLINDNIKDLF